MTIKPALVGVKQVKATEGLDINTILGRLGSNSGNMMFTEALHNVLLDSKLISWQISESEVSDRDSIVFAAANWLATGADFGHLAEKIEKTDLPVFLIGVGAQSGLEKKIPKLSEGTLKFLSIVSERSRSISTRGDFTCEVLEHYGFKNSVATGCPSLLLSGSGGPKFDRPATADRLVIHGTRHRFHKTDVFQDFIFNQALALKSDILLQSETPDIMISMGLDIPSEHKAQAIDALTQSYGNADYEKISEYLKANGRFFSDYDSWLDYIKTRSFCVGTRIHGTIASIIAGTPALLIAHDSRTEELAKAMGVPYVLADQIDTSEPLKIKSLLDAFSRKKNGFNYTEYSDRFYKFFDDNGIKYSVL